jgi:hypothetical protein
MDTVEGVVEQIEKTCHKHCAQEPLIAALALLIVEIRRLNELVEGIAPKPAE